MASRLHKLKEALGLKVITGREVIPWGYGVGPCPYDTREIHLYPVPINHVVSWFARWWTTRAMVARQAEFVHVDDVDRYVASVIKRMHDEAEARRDADYIEGYRHGWHRREGSVAFVRKCAPLMIKRPIINGP